MCCVCFVIVGCVCASQYFTQYEIVEGEKGNTHGSSVCGGLGGARRGPVWSTCAGDVDAMCCGFACGSLTSHLCDARELNEAVHGTCRARGRAPGCPEPLTPDS